MKIELAEQVLAFLRELAPEPRRRLRDAIRALAEGKGDIESLEEDLAGFHRLRVGRYRVIFWYKTIGQKIVLRCEFVEQRSLVYQMFSAATRQLKP